MIRAALAAVAVAVVLRALLADDQGRDSSTIKGAGRVVGTGPAPWWHLRMPLVWWPWRARVALAAAVLAPIGGALVGGVRGFLAVLASYVMAPALCRAAGGEPMLWVRRAHFVAESTSIFRASGATLTRDRALVRRAGGDGSVPYEAIPHLGGGRQSGPGTARWPVHPGRGQDLEALISATERIRTAVRAQSCMIVHDDTGRGGGWLTLSWRAQTAPAAVVDATPVPAVAHRPAPPAPPGPPAREIVLDAAVYGDGQHLRWPLLGADGARHLLIAGDTRTGKTSWVDAILHSLAPAEHVAIVYLDPAHVGAAPWAPRLTAVVHEDGRTAVLEWLRAETRRRFEALVEQDIDFVRHPTADMPAIVAIIDEFADLSKDEVAIVTRIAQQGLKCGVMLIVMTQHPDYTTLPTKARGQFERRVCLRVGEDTAAKAVLGSTTVDGLDPSAITVKGQAVCVGFLDSAVLARARWVDRDERKARAQATAAMRVPLPELEERLRRTT